MAENNWHYILPTQYRIVHNECCVLDVEVLVEPGVFQSFLQEAI